MTCGGEKRLQKNGKTRDTVISYRTPVTKRVRWKSNDRKIFFKKTHWYSDLKLCFTSFLFFSHLSFWRPYNKTNVKYVQTSPSLHKTFVTDGFIAVKGFAVRLPEKRIKQIYLKIHTLPTCCARTILFILPEIANENRKPWKIVGVTYAYSYEPTISNRRCAAVQCVT